LKSSVNKHQKNFAIVSTAWLQQSRVAHGEEAFFSQTWLEVSSQDCFYLRTN